MDPRSEGERELLRGWKTTGLTPRTMSEAAMEKSLPPRACSIPTFASPSDWLLLPPAPPQGCGPRDPWPSRDWCRAKAARGCGSSRGREAEADGKREVGNVRDGKADHRPLSASAGPCKAPESLARRSLRGSERVLRPPSWVFGGSSAPALLVCPRKDRFAVFPEVGRSWTLLLFLRVYYV